MKINGLEIKGFRDAVSATKKLGSYSFFNNEIQIYLDTNRNCLECYEFADTRSWMEGDGLVLVMRTQRAVTMEELKAELKGIIC